MISPAQSFPNEFNAADVWNAICAQLLQDLGTQVSVDTIGQEDFDEDGMLTLQAPAARVLFMEENPTEIENQGLNYESDMRFAVLCADDDRSPDPQDQRSKSLLLAGRVKHSLVGARLVLPDESVTYPIVYTGMKPIPTADLGMAYVPAFKIGGIASFGGPNAVPNSPGLPAQQGGL